MQNASAQIVVQFPNYLPAFQNICRTNRSRIQCIYRRRICTKQAYRKHVPQNALICDHHAKDQPNAMTKPFSCDFLIDLAHFLHPPLGCDLMRLSQTRYFPSHPLYATCDPTHSVLGFVHIPCLSHHLPKVRRLLRVTQVHARRLLHLIHTRHFFLLA